MSNIAIVYWTGTGNTEAMAKAIQEECQKQGKNAELIFSDDFNKDKLQDFDAIAFGCPAMGSENLEEESFEPMFSSLEGELKGKKLAIFGSYEWNNGEWMDDWEKRVKDQGLDLVYPGLAAYDYPDNQAIEKCKDLAKCLCQAL